MRKYLDALRAMPAGTRWLLAGMTLALAVLLAVFAWRSGPLPVVGALALAAVLAYLRRGHVRDTDGVSDAATCRECGGNCCRIYRQAGRGGSMPDEVPRKKHAEDFHGGLPPQEREYGTEPSYDDWRVHAEGDRAYRREVRASGIDTDYCAYWDPEDGCRVPRRLRPQQCRDFACEDLSRALSR